MALAAHDTITLRVGIGEALELSLMFIKRVTRDSGLELLLKIQTLAIGG